MTGMRRHIWTLSIQFLSSAGLLFAGSAVAAAADDTQDSPKIVLFDGKTLQNWDGDPLYWRVEDGAITGENTLKNPLKRSTYLLWRGPTFDDFKMTFEFRIVGGNSGVHFRSRETAKWQADGYQADISNWEDYTGVFYSSHRAQLAYRGESVEIDKLGKRTVTRFGDHDQLRRFVKKTGWNHYTVIAKGPHIMLCVNGILMSQGFDYETDKAARAGIVAIQLHDGPAMKIQIKNISMTKL
tara:strand:- start:274 stop:993 length:720 start_codon:yes stop_codon:yes gene_type:complete